MNHLKEQLKQKVQLNKEMIAKEYPNHCKHCFGRGGIMVDWYEDSTKFCACKHCVLKNIEPLDINLKILMPENYGLYEYEDGETFPMWWEDDDNAYHYSSILKLRFDDSFNWSKTKMGEIHYLNRLLQEIDDLETEIEDALSS